MKLSFVDIGANLTDTVFRGVYRGKQRHEDDFQEVLKRAKQVGMERIMVTAGRLSEAEEGVKLCEDHPGFLWTTVGVHPTRSEELEKAGRNYIDSMLRLAKSHPSVCALGELGLDYDRLQFSPREVQVRQFRHQLERAKEFGLPLFLHNRNSGGDFVRIIKEMREGFSTGCVHSFTGTVEEAQECLDLGLYIGVNGCSMKNDQNLEVVKRIPLDRLLLETGTK